jgi:predicted peptidase
MVVLALLPLVLAACGGGSEGAPSGPSSERLTLRPAGSVEGAPLGYVEYVPPSYGDGETRPLLVFLHGSGENGDGSEQALARVFKHGVPKLIERDRWPGGRPFIVLMPQYGPEEAYECGLTDEIAAFLRFAMDHYDVDAKRVYLTGISCGALGAWEYLAAHSDEVVAGAVLIAGYADRAFARAGCKLGRVPIWAFHGAADGVVPKTYVAVPMRELEACADPMPVDARLTIYPRAGHDAWSRTYDLSAGHDVYAWLLGHRQAR